ncbi:unnamed protein product [Adineta steineri]|uniref:UNC93-like protein MFSD11 n=1 Tax=Adineta steineri TaxID=433720 RepID=A0A819YG51_9BILA|nr:unnamed protein product [Adineta steineri]
MANIAETLKIAVRLLKTRNMLLLLISFAYTGDSLIFTDTRKRLIGLHGVLLGVGEILGGGLFGFITKPKTSSQRGLIIFIGFVLQIVFYYSVFINFPFDSPAKETNSKPYFEFDSLTSQVITFIGSFLVGLGDSSLNIQLLHVLASRYKETSASAFAIFQLVQGVTSAIAYLYASALGLEYHLLIITIGLIFSSLSFFVILFDDSNIDLSTSS